HEGNHSRPAHKDDGAIPAMATQVVEGYGKDEHEEELAVPLYHLGRHRWYRPVVLMGGSTVIALVASKWFAERTGLL
ncbi:MAG: hypothetical protein AAFU79_22005, partial [Myxococcota bacterium]